MIRKDAMPIRFRFPLVAFLIFLLAAGFSLAQPTVPNSFADGDVISAQAMNENFQAVLSAALAIEGLPGNCAAGEFLSFDGTNWTCTGVASGTTYSAGTGLSLSGGVFEVDFSTVAAAGHTHTDYLPSSGPATFTTGGASGALTIDQTPGDVALTTDGDVQVGSVKYASPRTSYYSVPAAAFSARDASVSNITKHYGNVGACDLNNAVPGIVAPVNLPHGAEYQAVTFFYNDNDASNDLSLSFWALDATTGYSYLLASHDSSGAPGGTSVTVAPSGSYADLFRPVDNSNSSFFVRATADNWNCNDMGVRQVTIEYTVTQAP